jgi:hypothetical protein
MANQEWSMMVILLSGNDSAGPDSESLITAVEVPSIKETNSGRSSEIPFELRSLNAEQAGELLGYKASYIRDHLACRRDFPKRVDSDGHPRWIAGDLIAWREGNRVDRRTHRHRK